MRQIDIWEGAGRGGKGRGKGVERLKKGESRGGKSYIGRMEGKKKKSRKNEEKEEEEEERIMWLG